jgi:Glycosyl hydrolase family 26
VGEIAADRIRFDAMKRLLLVLCLIPACRLPAEQPPVNPDPVTPPSGVLFGSYIDFGETEDHVTLEAIEAFEKLAGKQPAIIASSSYWGEQSFPSKNISLISRYGAIPMVYWSPWDKPYAEEKGPDQFSLKEILAGKWDAYIDEWADGAKAFGKPFFVSFCNEMNGDWFPWSGVYYGAEKGGDKVFKQAWRYVVDRTRARGAKNILWVFHVNAFPAINDVWNTMASYYPGSDYVDWLGLSIYGKQFRNEGNWAYFPDLIKWPYEEITALDPNKPVMLAEFGVGDFPKAGDKARWISDALTAIPEHPRMKAAIYWHERWQNEDGTYSNLRINSSPLVLKAFREGLSRPDWVGKKGGASIP